MARRYQGTQGLPVANKMTGFIDSTNEGFGQGGETLRRKKNFLIQRAHLTRKLRAYFEGCGFLEVETPTLTPWGTCEAYIDPLVTTLEDDRRREGPAYFIPSPEISLKKLVAAGYGPVFELARVFRNGEPLGGPHHNHQFTLLEWYEPGKNYRNLMERLGQLLAHLCPGPLTYQGVSYRLDPLAITVWQAFENWAHLPLPVPKQRGDLADWSFLYKVCEERGHGKAATLDDAFYLLFLNEIEPHLRQIKRPVLIFDYPAFQGAFAQLDETGRWAQRVELYLAGVELANGYTELADPVEQLKRFQEGNETRRSRGRESQPVDQQFLGALPQLGACGGMALGWDRLVMLLTDAPAIHHVLSFSDGELFHKTLHKKDPRAP